MPFQRLEAVRYDGSVSRSRILIKSNSNWQSGITATLSDKGGRGQGKDGKIDLVEKSWLYVTGLSDIGVLGST